MEENKPIKGELIKMLFKNTKKLVFVEEKRIQPKDESKSPFSIC